MRAALCGRRGTEGAMTTGKLADWLADLFIEWQGALFMAIGAAMFMFVAGYVISDGSSSSVGETVLLAITGIVGVFLIIYGRSIAPSLWGEDDEFMWY